MRAIADARPEPTDLAGGLGRVRALLDRERARLRRRLGEGAPIDEVAQAEARLLDQTVIGLCDLAGLLERGATAVPPPLAVLACRDYGRRRLSLGAIADLMFLVAPNPVDLEKGLALAQFVARELAALGWQVRGVRRTVCGCLAETHLDPALAFDLGTARLVWGCRGLFAEMHAGLAQATERARARTTWRMAAPAAGAMLPA